MVFVDIRDNILMGGVVCFLPIIYPFFSYSILKIANFLLYKEHLKLKRYILSIFIFLIIYFGISYFLGFFINKLYFLITNEDEVLRTSLFLLKLDKIIFGDYFFHIFHWGIKFNEFLSVLFYYVYFNISIMMCFIWVGLLYKDVKIFSHYILSILIALMLALPIWYFIPAVSPQELLIDGVFNKSLIPSDIANTLAIVKYDHYMIKSLKIFDFIWNSTKDTVYYVSTLPSMHIVWAYIVLYFSVKINKRLFPIFGGFFILTCIAVLYLLQHYFLDIPSGILVAHIAIWISNKLLAKADLQFINIYQKEFHDDINRVGSLLKKIKSYIL